MKVLSLFDGCSMARVAMERLGIECDYYASEIDKYATKVSEANYPDIIRLGDVTQVKGFPVDLLIGGSPCQGFSFAGKQLNFDDPRSALFFEYVRLLEECSPKYFLLENVKMKQEHQDVISDQLGVQPIEINSGLVSAQNRKRLFWTNIPNVVQPENKKILLMDILEDNPNSPTLMPDRFVQRQKGRKCLTDANKAKASCLSAMEYVKNGRQGDYLRCNQVGVATDIKGNESIKRVYHPYGKSPCLTTMGGGHREPKVLEDYEHYRKLTPVECERLQTLPDGYTAHVSNTQRYKMLGNGFTVDVIAHILKGMK